MKLIADFFPVILFFVAYQAYDIYVATGVAIAASFVQTGWHRVRSGKFENMHLVTFGLLLVFGGMTIALRDPTFIKWKPTIVNWLFAAAFYVSGLLMERNLLERMMDHAFEMPKAIWARLNLIWVAFFIFSGALNLYVAYNFSEEFWVNFKLFGMLGLTLAFVIAQGFYLASHAQQVEPQSEE